MRLTLYFLPILALLLCYCKPSFAQLSPKSEPKVLSRTENKAPRIVWETLFHNFGAVPTNELKTYIFEFTNTGPNPVYIQSVKPDCPFIRTSYSSSQIEPSGKGWVKISLKYDQPKDVTCMIRVRSNSKDIVNVLKINAKIK